MSYRSDATEAIDQITRSLDAGMEPDAAMAMRVKTAHVSAMLAVAQAVQEQTKVLEDIASHLKQVARRR